jgi:L-amino acid N-acyltransferase YncA
MPTRQRQTTAMKTVVRRATPDDAGQIVQVMNSVIAEGKYTIFDKPFSEEEERSFILSLGNRSALYVAEIRGEIGGVQSIDVFANFAASVRHVATMGTWLHLDFRGRGIGRLLAEESFRFARSNGYAKVVVQVLAGIFHDEVYLEKLL